MRSRLLHTALLSLLLMSAAGCTSPEGADGADAPPAACQIEADLGGNLTDCGPRFREVPVQPDVPAGWVCISEFQAGGPDGRVLRFFRDPASRQLGFSYEHGRSPGFGAMRLASGSSEALLSWAEPDAGRVQVFVATGVAEAVEDTVRFDLFVSPFAYSVEGPLADATSVRPVWVWLDQIEVAHEVLLPSGPAYFSHRAATPGGGSTTLTDFSEQGPFGRFSVDVPITFYGGGMPGGTVGCGLPVPLVPGLGPSSGPP